MSQPCLSRIKSRTDEAKYWAEQALAYFECSKILDSSESEYKSMPSVTLQAFSAECSLKALIISETTNVKIHGHKLNVLFGQLPHALKSTLSQDYINEFGLGPNGEGLVENIEEVSNDFIDSRYWHEDLKTKLFGRAFAVGYLDAISELLIKCLVEKSLVER